LGGRHWVGNGFPVRSIFSYQDRAEVFSPFLLLDHAGLTHFESTTAAKLMTAVAQRLTERLRESSQKLQVTSKLVVTLQEELDRLMPTPQGKQRG